MNVGFEKVSAKKIRIDAVNEKCKSCINLKTWSVSMDGSHRYACPKNPEFRKGNCDECKKYEPKYEIVDVMTLDVIDGRAGSTLMHIDLKKY